MYRRDGVRREARQMKVQFISIIQICIYTESRAAVNALTAETYNGRRINMLERKKISVKERKTGRKLQAIGRHIGKGKKMLWE